MVHQTERARQRRVKAHLQRHHRPHPGVIPPGGAFPNHGFHLSTHPRPGAPSRIGLTANEKLLLILAALFGLIAFCLSFIAPYTVYAFIFGGLACLFVLIFAITLALHPRG